MASGTGNLPYPGKVYNPFDVLTAEELNEDVANIESLADGTGLGDLSIPTSAIQDGAVTPAKRSGGFKIVTQSFTGTGTRQVTGAGFTPKAVLVMPVHTTDTINSRFIMTFYDGTTGVNQRTGSRIQATSGAYTRSTSSSTGYITNSSFSTGAEDNIFTGDITGFTSDGCTVNVASNGNANYSTFMFFFMG